MTDLVTNTWLLETVLGGMAGGVLGTIHFMSLRWNIERFITGNITMAIIGQLLRLGLLGMGLLALAKWGVISLIAGTLGLILARQVILIRSRAMP